MGLWLYAWFQGVKAVIAESYERIHRSNLVGMGIIPFQYQDGESATTLGLTGREKYTINLPQNLQPGQLVTVQVGVESLGWECIHVFKGESDLDDERDDDGEDDNDCMIWW